MATIKQPPAVRRPEATEPTGPNDRVTRVAFNILMALLVLSLIAMIWIALV
jgi:hypothetical protein